MAREVGAKVSDVDAPQSAISPRWNLPIVNARDKCPSVDVKKFSGHDEGHG